MEKSKINLHLLFLGSRYNVFKISLNNVCPVICPSFEGFIKAEPTDPCSISHVKTNVVSVDGQVTSYTALPDGRPLRTVKEQVLRDLYNRDAVTRNLISDKQWAMFFRCTQNSHDDILLFWH